MFEKPLAVARPSLHRGWNNGDQQLQGYFTTARQLIGKVREVHIPHPDLLSHKGKSKAILTMKWLWKQQSFLVEYRTECLFLTFLLTMHSSTVMKSTLLLPSKIRFVPPLRSKSGWKKESRNYWLWCQEGFVAKRDLEKNTTIDISRQRSYKQKRQSRLWQFKLWIRDTYKKSD